MVEMSALNDFPGSLITNLWILHDFAEIAYIVCTHAIPATSGSTPDANSPEQILTRLKNAEKQFRQASILVALDTAKLELFTFYKKVDVVRDQRTILSKFGLVCRLNSCIIARKSTARVLELLKPESSRVYQLFTSAILHSVQLSPRVSGAAIPIGLRRYLVPTVADIEKDGEHAPCIEWQLCRIDLQVTTSGQVILTAQKSRNGILRQLKNDQDDYDVNENVVKRGSFIYLVPTGQLARYIGPWDERFLREGITENLQPTIQAYQSWSASVTAWLQEYPTAQANMSERKGWVEIEVPVLEDRSSTDNLENNTIVWKAICWPSSLAFVIASTNALGASKEPMAIDSDPLSFIQDWYAGSAERNVAIANAELLVQQNHSQVDEEPLFGDDVTFEDPDPDPAHLFGPPAFPASQTIYPTPPEGMLTQHTPGMSMDGIAPTPLNVGTAPHVTEASEEIEMQDAIESRPVSAKDGMYEDDLFEEIPDENFDSGGVGDEPNWDFFDEPGFEAHNHRRTNSVNRVQHQNVHENASTAGLANHHLHQEPLTSTSVIFKPADIPNDVKNEVSVNQELAQDPKHAKMENIEYDIKPCSSPTVQTDISNEANALISTPYHMHTFKKPYTSDNHEPGRLGSVTRRSSVFDVILPTSASPRNDSKYQRRGKYWFDHTGMSDSVNPENMASRLPTRPVSISSDSSMTSDDSGSVDSGRNSVQPRAVYQQWTKFEPQSIKQQNQPEDDHEIATSQTYISEILDVIKVASGDEPFLYDIESSDTTNKRPFYDGQRASMVAQIFVEQISQSSLYRDVRSVQLHLNAAVPNIKLSMDHSEVKQAVVNASLAEVTSFNTSSSTASGRSKMVRLECPRIHVNRMDKEIKVSPSALSYWETLGLQPLNGQKDVTALCLHPSSSNVSDGCAAFMARIADMYAGCNFGTHDIGRIASITNDGLIPWLPASNSTRTLKSVCQRLGNALPSTFSAGTTILVYMVSPVEELFCYREMCHAFTLLFDSFVKASQLHAKSVELALQIIPISFLASSEILVIPSQESYLELALEIYNRLPPKTSSQQLAACGTAVILEECQPKDIGFDLSIIAVNPIHRNGEQLHMAYSYSFDKRWLTAAWCDERGTISLTMSYSLRSRNDKDGSTRPRREILRDLWDVSHDIMEKQRSRWRLVVARSGFYDDDELRDWLSFNNQNNAERKAVARLILLSVMVEPTTLLHPPISLLKGPTTSLTGPGPNLTATPVSTPQTITTSPDQGIAATPTYAFQPTNAPTPPDHNLDTSGDQEVTLFNPNDECWSAVFAFGVNQSHDPLNIRPAAASGLLIKRVSNKENNCGLTSIEVHLVATSRLTQTVPTQMERESLLEGILMQFRRLATLAVTRGCIDQDREYVPWHVATAIKGSKILGEVL